MKLEDYFDFLAPDDIRLKGTRVGIESVLYEYVHRLQTPEAIAQRFPTLTLDQVYATILVLPVQSPADGRVSGRLARMELPRVRRAAAQPARLCHEPGNAEGRKGEVPGDISPASSCSTQSCR